MALSRTDAEAIAGLANRLGVHPGTLGGLMEMESGINPNIWGGAGGQYRGLIQFGPGARKEVGLPDGPMSISDQIPYVEKYFKQRGFQPGKHGATELYRTVLVGNPHQSGTDSFGTNSDSAAKRMQPGGDLFNRAMAKLGGVSGGPSPSRAATSSNSGSSLDPITALLGGVDDSPLPAPDALTPRKSGSSVFDIAAAGAVTPFAGARPEVAKLLVASLAPGLMGAAAAVPADDGLDALAKALLGGGDDAPAPAATPRPAAPTTDNGESISIVDFGKELQKRGLKVAENPAFGSVGKHSPSSLHYSGNALDITDWNGPANGKWKDRLGAIGQIMRRSMGKSAEVFDPWYDPIGNHSNGMNSHLHLGLPGGKISRRAADSILAQIPGVFKQYAG